MSKTERRLDKPVALLQQFVANTPPLALGFMPCCLPAALQLHDGHTDIRNLVRRFQPRLTDRLVNLDNISLDRRQGRGSLHCFLLQRTRYFRHSVGPRQFLLQHRRFNLLPSLRLLLPRLRNLLS